MNFRRKFSVMRKGVEPTKLTAAEVKGRMDRGEPFAFVDARGLNEWSQSDSTLPGAIRLTASEVEQHLQEIPQGRTIIAYCSHPNEESSTRLAVELMRRGFLNVHPMIGGIEAWRVAGGPTERK
jgi:rhodanese-related sulfurtransferase